MRESMRILKRIGAGGVALTMSVGGVAGCSSVPAAYIDEKAYHCVSRSRPIPPPNIWAKTLPLEEFEYGDYRIESSPTVGTGGYCATLHVPKTAYLRYRVEGRVIEKRFDLSSLTARRVYNKTVEFYVYDDTVEVRLVTPVQGDRPIKELIERR